MAPRMSPRPSLPGLVSHMPGVSRPESRAASGRERTAARPVAPGARPPPMSRTRRPSGTGSDRGVARCSETPAWRRSAKTATAWSWAKWRMSCRVRQPGAENSGAWGSVRVSLATRRSSRRRVRYSGSSGDRLLSGVGRFSEAPRVTRPEAASTVTTSPLGRAASAPGKPKRAGTRYSRATAARCPAASPTSATMAPARRNSGLKAGEAERVTAMAPSGKVAAGVVSSTATTIPEAIPRQAASPPPRRTSFGDGSATVVAAWGRVSTDSKTAWPEVSRQKPTCSGAPSSRSAVMACPARAAATAGDSRLSPRAGPPGPASGAFAPSGRR